MLDDCTAMVISQAEQQGDRAATAAQHGVERPLDPVGDEVPHVLRDEGERDEDHDEPGDHHQGAEHVAVDTQVARCPRSSRPVLDPLP